MGYRACPFSGSRGFTLVETLVVLVIIGLAASVLVPALGPIRERSVASRAASDIRRLLGEARDRAVSVRTPVHLDYDIAGRRLVIRETGRSLGLAGDVGLSLMTGASVGIGSEKGESSPSFLFLPDGTGSGGVVTVRIGQATRRLGVSWLTGAVDDGE